MQSQCSRGDRPGQWLWSFDMDQQCLLVQELNPFNLSREESQMVSLNTLSMIDQLLMIDGSAVDLETVFPPLRCL